MNNIKLRSGLTPIKPVKLLSKLKSGLTPIKPVKTPCRLKSGLTPIRPEKLSHTLTPAPRPFNCGFSPVSPSVKRNLDFSASPFLMKKNRQPSKAVLLQRSKEIQEMILKLSAEEEEIKKQIEMLEKEETVDKVRQEQDNFAKVQDTCESPLEKCYDRLQKLPFRDCSPRCSQSQCTLKNITVIRTFAPI